MMHATAVTPATSYSKEDSNSLLARNSRNASNSKNESYNRLPTAEKTEELAKVVKTATA